MHKEFKTGPAIAKKSLKLENWPSKGNRRVSEFNSNDAK